MSRLSSIRKLEPETRNQVEAFIASHPHYSIEKTIVELKKSGLPTFSRSALGRYLQGRNGAPHTAELQTIVTVVNPLTGSVQIFKTPASSEIVGASVAKLTAKYAIT